MENDNIYEKQALKATLSAIGLNSLLCVMKLIAGLLGKSAALTSDAIQSAGDVLRGVIVAVGVKMGSKAADKQHPYGHEIFECVTAIILAFLIAATGCVLGYQSLTALIGGKNGEAPSVIALAAAALSVLIKALMFVSASKKAKILRSPALKAESQDHLSDVSASSGVCVGIVGAMLGFPAADSIAGFVMSLLIIRTALEIFKENAGMVTDESAGQALEEEMEQSILETGGVIRIDLLRTRRFGNRVYVELEIAVNKDMKMEEAHTIAQDVHDRIEANFAPVVKHCMVHLNPA